MDWTIIGLLVTFMAGVLFTVFVVSLLAAAGKDAPTPPGLRLDGGLEALSAVMAEQYDAGKESGRAESMRRRVGPDEDDIPSFEYKEARELRERGYVRVNDPRKREPHQVAVDQMRMEREAR